MTSTERHLMNAWESLCGRMNLPAAGGIGPALLARYAEPHRAYHTADHLRQVVDQLARIQADDRLMLAAWFHDSVYQPTLPDNEACSAMLARDCLTVAGCPEASVKFVCEAILATVGHRAEHCEFDPLLDADLAVLGAAEPVYDAYRAGIRKEYRALSEAVFQAGRAQFIRSLLKRASIYRTNHCRASLEIAARRNLLAELLDLSPVEGEGRCN